MKQHIFISFLNFLNVLVLTNQKGEEQTTLSTNEDGGVNMTNSTPVYHDYYDADFAPCQLYVPGLDSLCLMVVYIIVFVFSIVGNSVVLFVVCTMKKSRTSTDIYLMHLAMADFLFCLTLPFYAAYGHFHWIFGDFLCKLLSGFQEVSVYSGVFLLACISVDRYFAIVRATRRLSSRHMVVKVICGIVWLVAGVLSLPVAIKKESMYDYDLRGNICYENIIGESSEHWQISIRVLRHIVGFFLPLVVMTVCYSWTVVTLCHTRNHRKYKVMRVILAVVLAFIICWLPHNASVLIDTLMRGGSLPKGSCETRYRVEMMLEVTQVLAFMHCAVNPVLYAFIGEKFRNQLLVALFKHGLISQRVWVSYKKGSLNSTASSKSRNTSVSTQMTPDG